MVLPNWLLMLSGQRCLLQELEIDLCVLEENVEIVSIDSVDKLSYLHVL